MSYRGLLLLGVSATSLALGSVGAHAQWTSRISVDSQGGEGNDDSYGSALSADGRIVAFLSHASNLVPGDTNRLWDLFVRDRSTGVTSRVNVSSNGMEAKGGETYAPRISADGRYVAFYSYATNLVVNDNNGGADIFVHDRSTGTTTRVSVDSNGVEANGSSFSPSISANGRYVAFGSYATNLVPGDTNGFQDVFLHDRVTKTTTRLSLDSSGGQGNRDSGAPSLSDNGRYVSFASSASNLVPSDTNGVMDVFRHDRITGTTLLVSVDSAGNQADLESASSCISADGSIVAFHSRAGTLVPGGTPGRYHLFVHEMTTGLTTRVSVDSAGTEANDDSFAFGLFLSGDGNRVVFMSDASNLVANDTNGWADVFLHDRSTGTTERISVNDHGGECHVGGAGPDVAISADGRVCAFTSSGKLVKGETGRDRDVYAFAPLTLAVDPPTVSAGTLQRFDVWTGRPGELASLRLIAVQGVPTHRALATGHFDERGVVGFAGTVPPGLSGMTVTVICASPEGSASSGSATLSNAVDVTYQ